jgi:heme/copper-type cytochrome/quinol oxidase subunit 2
MRLIVLEVLAIIATLVFLSMLVATARHQTAGGSEGSHSRSALAECMWAIVPWLMIAACVLPSVRRILAGD